VVVVGVSLLDFLQLGSVSGSQLDSEARELAVAYGETDAGGCWPWYWLKRGEKIRVVTAHDLDAGQKKDYLARRLRGA
jgi:hypothetical protein